MSCYIIYCDILVKKTSTVELYVFVSHDNKDPPTGIDDLNTLLGIGIWQGDPKENDSSWAGYVQRFVHKPSGSAKASHFVFAWEVSFDCCR